MSKPKVIVTRKLPDYTETLLSRLYDTQLNHDDRAMSSTVLQQAMIEADILIPTVTDRIDSNMLQAAAQAGRLKMIASFGTGVDHIDVMNAERCGITICNTPDVLSEDTADMAMALILSVPRRMIEGEKFFRSGQWQGWSPTSMLGHRIWGKKLGIIGMGRIGQALAKRAKGFNMSIHYHNRSPVDPLIAQALDATYYASLDRMLAHVDIISIHCPHTPATFHLLNERRLKLLAPHTIVINTSRGEIIAEKALIKALKRQEIAGVGLDVFEHEENFNPDWLTMDNAVLLPHMGSATIEGRDSMGEKILDNIRAFLAGEELPDRVLADQF